MSAGHVGAPEYLPFLQQSKTELQLVGKFLNSQKLCSHLRQTILLTTHSQKVYFLTTYFTTNILSCLLEHITCQSITFSKTRISGPCPLKVLAPTPQPQHSHNHLQNKMFPTHKMFVPPIIQNICPLPAVQKIVAPLYLKMRTPPPLCVRLRILYFLELLYQVKIICFNFFPFGSQDIWSYLVLQSRIEKF